MKKLVFSFCILSILCFGGCSLMNEADSERVEKHQEETAEIVEDMRMTEVEEKEEIREEDIPTPAYMTDITDETYCNIITQLIETKHFPVCNYEADNPGYNQVYAILDVDSDGRDELIINYSNASTMAGTVYYVYDYNRITGEVYIECSGWPDVDFLDNGYLVEAASHNHGRSDLDDFWPYRLLVYNAETDIYDILTHVDAWQRELHPKDFPDEADKDGDGIVYYTATDSYVPTSFMDREEYVVWCERFNTGTAKEIRWKTIITIEEYQAIYMQDAVG